MAADVAVTPAPVVGDPDAIVANPKPDDALDSEH